MGGVGMHAQHGDTVGNAERLSVGVGDDENGCSGSRVSWNLLAAE
jgi:hypothetical protein